MYDNGRSIFYRSGTWILLYRSNGKGMSVAGVEEEIKVPDSAGKWGFYGVCLYRQGVIGTYMIIA